VAKPVGHTIPPLTGFVPRHDKDFSAYAQIFPRREGEKPATTNAEPHQQITQHGDVRLWDELKRRCFTQLPGVVEADSKISIPGATALWLDKSHAVGPKDAFIIEREFAHMHPHPDASLHLQLPLEVAVFAIAGGWAEPHIVVWMGFATPGSVMVFAPRDDEELEVVWNLIQESYRYAIGEAPAFKREPQINARA
jgi:hypothetical protein